MSQVQIDSKECDLPISIDGLLDVEGESASRSQFEVEYLELSAVFSDYHIGSLSIEQYARRFWENELIRSMHDGARSIVWRERPTLGIQNIKCLITGDFSVICRTYGRYHFLDYIPGTLRK